MSALRGLDIVADGDSWFGTPIHNTLTRLEDLYRCRTHSAAGNGHTLCSMAYDSGQLAGVARVMSKLRESGREPAAILLSAGGNDLVGDGLHKLLNHKQSGLPPIGEGVLVSMIDERLQTAMIHMLGFLTNRSYAFFGRAIPILIHGYGYPVPDGRAFANGFLGIGPWLRPAFVMNGYSLDESMRVMRTLIDRFNEMLGLVVRVPGLEHVRHVDLRATLSPSDWQDELHPDQRGYGLVAGAFNRVLETLQEAA